MMYIGFEVLSCFMIAHIFKDKNKVTVYINSLNLLVFFVAESVLKVKSLKRISW